MKHPRIGVGNTWRFKGCFRRRNTSESDQTEKSFLLREQLLKRHVFPTPIRECFNPPHPPPSPFSSSSFSSDLHRLPLQGQDFETAFVYHSSVLVCTPLVFVCTAWDVVPLGFLYSVCTRLYSACTRLYRLACRPPRFLYSVCTRLYPFVFRLYSFVPPGMLFRRSICIPFVSVCTLTPFGEYNTIRRREEYKSIKMRKCDPSIVLGARWPNGITTARAAAAAPVRPRGKGKGARLRACVRMCVCLLMRSVFYLPALPEARFNH